MQDLSDSAANGCRIYEYQKVYIGKVPQRLYYRFDGKGEKSASGGLPHVNERSGKPWVVQEGWF